MLSGWYFLWHIATYSDVLMRIRDTFFFKISIVVQALKKAWPFQWWAYRWIQCMGLYMDPLLFQTVIIIYSTKYINSATTANKWPSLLLHIIRSENLTWVNAAGILIGVRCNCFRSKWIFSIEKVGWNIFQLSIFHYVETFGHNEIFN